MLDQILRNVELENEGEGEGGTVVGSEGEEGQEKNKGQQYEEEERPAALRGMETQVRKSLNVLWMSEGWDGVTGRGESESAGPLAEASRATTLGETNAGVATDRDPTPPTDAVIRPNPNLCVTTLTPSVVSPCEPAFTATVTTPATQELRRLAHAQEWSSKRFLEWSPIRRSPERSKKRWSPKRRASPPLLLLPESLSAASGGGGPPAGSKSPSLATIAAFRSTSTEDGARAVAFSAFLWSHGYRGESGAGSAVVTEASFPGGALRQFEHTLDFLNSTPAMGLGREAPSGGTPTPSSICWRYAKTIHLQRHRQEQQRRRRIQRRQQLQLQLQRTEPISKQVGPTVRYKSTDQVETERRERASPQTQPKGESLSPTKEDDRGFLPPPPLFKSTQRLQKERPVPQQAEKDGGKHDLEVPPPPPPSSPVSLSPPLRGAASQHQQQQTAQSGSTGNASAPAPPATGSAATAPVAGSGASWHSYSDMPARKKMFVQIVKFFREQKPSTLPGWVQKVKKRTSFPTALEAVLYQQASSLGDYEDYTAVGPRVSRIIRSMNKEARASATTNDNNWREKILQRAQVVRKRPEPSPPSTVQVLLSSFWSTLHRLPPLVLTSTLDNQIWDAMAKADRTAHSNGGKDKQQAHNCQATLAAAPERGVLPMKEAGNPHNAQQGVRAAQTPEENSTVAAKAMGEAAAAGAAVGTSKDEEGARKPMSRAARRAAERERVKGAAKAAKSARLQQHLAQQNLRKSNDPRRVEGKLLVVADNPPASTQPVPPPEPKPGEKNETKPGGKTAQKVAPGGGGDNGGAATGGTTCAAGAVVDDTAALGGKRAAAAPGERTPPKIEKKAEDEKNTSASAVQSPTRTPTGVAVAAVAAAAAAAGSRISIPSEPAAAPGKAQTAQSARAAKAPAVTAATKREVSQAPAEERGNCSAARAAAAAVLEETVTETISSRSSPGGEWTWPLLALDGGGGALKEKSTATAPLRRLAWIGRAAGLTAGNRAEPLPWGNWKRWREPEKWEKTVSTAITRAQLKVGFEVDACRLRNKSV
ncbi:unnamed protein product [Ectocarpus sp. CCAP 1310/34]|nr:unnamed protein product [Ectocarpus sp. CCAP 1310/34]